MKVGSETKSIILVGGGGHCRSVIDVIELEGIYKIAGIIDIKEKVGQMVMGYPILACDEQLSDLFTTYKNAIITIGHIKSNELRVKLYNQLKRIGFELPVIISPQSYVSRHSKISDGTVVMHHALINANAQIGSNCIINSKALVEHDAIIENHCHIATASVINGGVKVSEGSFIGSNATSKQGSALSGFINAGAVVK